MRLFIPCKTAAVLLKRRPFNCQLLLPGGEGFAFLAPGLTWTQPMHCRASSPGPEVKVLPECSTHGKEGAFNSGKGKREWICCTKGSRDQTLSPHTSWCRRLQAGPGCGASLPVPGGAQHRCWDGTASGFQDLQLSTEEEAQRTPGKSPRVWQTPKHRERTVQCGAPPKARRRALLPVPVPASSGRQKPPPAASREQHTCSWKWPQTDLERGLWKLQLWL